MADFGDMESEDIAVGIDLGTTFSCVSVYRKSKKDAEAIVNFVSGQYTTPSCVSFIEDAVEVGAHPKAHLPFFSKNTVVQAKRIIGREFQDREVQLTRASVQYDIVEDGNSVAIRIPGQQKLITPATVSSKVLKMLKESAEKNIGKDITKAIVTIPAKFDARQREQTMAAAKLAGLDVISLLDEPTAAAIAYGYHLREEKTLLVFDFGGGTLDITILQATDGFAFKSLGSDGDMHLGGEDYDNLLADYIADEFCRKNAITKDALEADKVAFGTIRQKAMETKERFATVESALIFMPPFFQGKAFQQTMLRSKFEEITKPLSDRILLPVNKTLAIARMDTDEIDDVVLVGGSSRLPQVQDILEAKFGKDKLRRSIDFDRAISQGAAILAFSLRQSKTGHEINLQDCVVVEQINNVPLGIRVNATEKLFDRFSIIIGQGDALPASAEQSYSNLTDGATCVDIDIFQGFNETASENKYLGTFEIRDLPPKPKNQHKYVVKMSLDDSGLLHVTGRETLSGKYGQLTITCLPKNSIGFAQP